MNTAEDISLDGDKVFKNKSEEIVLLVQPVKRVNFTMDTMAIMDAASAEAYLEQNYSFLHVTGSEAAPVEDPNKRTMPEGTVIGIRLADGTLISSFLANNRSLFVDVVETPINVVLLLATGEDWVLG